MNPLLIALVPAAGIGARAARAQGLPKQYALLGGQPMLRRTVCALLADARIAQVRVAVALGDPWVDAALAGLPRTVWRPCGGPSRADTVRAALHDAELPPDAWVLVHDAARPGLPAQALSDLIETCWRHDCGGLLALPVADTVKLAADCAGTGPIAPEVCRTLARDHLWLAQTPQMFPAAELLSALDACAQDDRITDEASALEYSGGRSPLLVRGSRRNDKLTWPEDFDWYETWLQNSPTIFSKDAG
ncbi:IspD/TarI family cytidylyltransferase [Castellaniella sp.]|uniref:IspD/TarI family cytidylyltransferase n=1 Tax=Castellaniella sp. TaxID=1955812 RepID=UPI002AFF0984|nr:2-C-methyl-D-erythritol 4-phosphate cytidylyltransferase [Castellaniella sp.]